MWKLPGYQVDELLYETVRRVVEARIRKEVTIAEQQFGFMPGRSTTDAIFCLRMFLEKWTEGQKAVNCAFIDLEKAYDRVPREELWECLRLAETSECYITIIKDIYDGETTTVRSAAGLTEEFSRCWTSPTLSTQPIPFCHHHGQADGGHQEGCTMGYAV